MRDRTSNFRPTTSPYLRAILLIGLIGGLFFWISATSGTATFARLNRLAQANASGAQDKSSDSLWRFEDETIARAESQEEGPIRAFRRVALSKTLFTSLLREAPMESSADATRKRTILTLPIADGTLARFSMVESPIMAPELAARYPDIKTYAAQGVDDPTTTARFDWTPAGFHGIILSPRGTVLIEPASVGDVENYIVYFQGDVTVGSGECAVTTEEQETAAMHEPQLKKSSPAVSAVTSGSALRTYRVAVAATAEYTQAYGGGTVPGGLAAVTTTMNLVNAIYERELAIRLTLIANNDALIFTDPATDGYTPDNAGALIGENQVKLNAVIGSANYDVGHVFDGRILGGGSFSWTGLAGFNAVCGSNKARGVDIFRSVSPTNLFAYYSAAHEFGHQFGATHTFNTTSGTCGGQRSSSTAYEPYNGSTIMAYRFACAPDDLRSTDTYFHNASIEQIVSFTTAGNGNTCPVQTGTGNNPPTVDAGPSYTIPMGTPFILTATGSDPDGDAVTFGWEEFDLGAPAPPNTDDGSRPIFRSFAPVSFPSRTFPRLQDVLSGFETMGESLPTTTRAMNFRVTARDNRSGGGGVNSDGTQVNVRADAGPFTVTQPASGANWATGSVQTVLWNVANTNNAPVSCANVRITLSTDDGSTFPIVLADNTPNDGSEAVTIPGTPTPAARIKVEAVGNIFFNISRSFTITGTATQTLTVASINPGSGVNITVSPNDNSGLGNGVTQFTRTYNRNTMVTLTAPSSVAGNHFLKWQRNGLDYNFNLTAFVSLDANYTMTAVYVAPPVIITETGTNKVAAVDSVTFVRGPFRLFNPYNFSSDQRTRIIFFTSDLGLTQPNPALLSVQASGFPLTVESVGPLSGVPGLNTSYIVVRLPDGLPANTDLQLTVTLGTGTSSPAVLNIVP